jgi:hypothetical protein
MYFEDLLPKLIFLAVAAAVVWFVLRPDYAFIVVIENGAARTARGKVTEAFLREIQTICADCRLPRGTIKGVRQGKRVRLTFSAHIPRQYRQRFRNAWMLWA